jgi:GDP/UDP-N,N'-diacetylbacillosamine 2-epimerase (hydrolysing)
MTPPARTICFVTGTRAEFGLMRSTLSALRDHPALQLQLVATGMHLSARHGRTIDAIRADGWTVDATVPWTGPTLAAQTGRATAALATTLDRLGSDVVLVVGDRVEPFAAATAAHLSGRVVAHVHGGDRALGQVDDALRHAITKLAHVHFPATPASAARLLRLGEDRWRIHRVGSPGIDGIVAAAGPISHGPPEMYALVVLHPTDADEAIEQRRAEMLLAAVRSTALVPVIVYPNNDPGHGGIVRCWQQLGGTHVHRDVARPAFLALMRDAAVLVGNSSSGIIEAASFGTPVVDVGPRQAGREHGPNVLRVQWGKRRLATALATMVGRRFPARNPYGGHDTGRRIADVLAKVALTDRLRRKLIAY